MCHSQQPKKKKKQYIYVCKFQHRVTSTFLLFHLSILPSEDSPKPINQTSNVKCSRRIQRKKMASLTYTTLDVFTSKKYTGNQLAVVHLPSSITLTQAQKQTITREFDYSETVFVHQPPTTTTSDGIPEWRVDIFTVQEEIPFAGHPTIGTAVHCLRSLKPSAADGEVVRGRFKVKAGVLELEYRDGVARARIPHNFHIHGQHTLRLPQILSQQPKLEAVLGEGPAGATAGDLDLQVVSPVRGMSFGMLALPSLEALGAVTTTGARVAAELDEGWDMGPLMMMFYVRLESAEEGVVKLRTRMIEGSFEDPATGSASVALGAMIALREKREGRTRFELVQAVEMGRKSEIGVEIVVEGGLVKTAELIGGAVEVMEGKLFYE